MNKKIIAFIATCSLFPFLSSCRNSGSISKDEFFKLYENSLKNRGSEKYSLLSSSGYIISSGNKIPFEEITLDISSNFDGTYSCGASSDYQVPVAFRSIDSLSLYYSQLEKIAENLNSKISFFVDDIYFGINLASSNKEFYLNSKIIFNDFGFASLYSWNIKSESETYDFSYSFFSYRNPIRISETDFFSRYEEMIKERGSIQYTNASVDGHFFKTGIENQYFVSEPITLQYSSGIITPISKQSFFDEVPLGFTDVDSCKDYFAIYSKMSSDVTLIYERDGQRLFYAAEVMFSFDHPSMDIRFKFDGLGYVYKTTIYTDVKEESVMPKTDLEMVISNYQDLN